MKNKDKLFSRRQFLKRHSQTAAALTMITALPPLAFGQSKEPILHIRPRYHRWHVDPGVEWIETNTGYATLDWRIPLSQSAIVLVDVWQRHYLSDTEARGEKVINGKLFPLVSKCRDMNMNIIHAPSPEVAMQHSNWVKLVNKPSHRSPRKMSGRQGISATSRESSKSTGARMNLVKKKDRNYHR